MKHTIELSIEDINRIVVEDLQNTFKWHLDDEEAQRELMDAIEVLLNQVIIAHGLFREVEMSEQIKSIESNNKREWVALTNDEIDDLWKTEYFNLHYELARAIEAKLKERNNG
jgi:predicted metallo-beta-lactamase superfamily hydrolase